MEEVIIAGWYRAAVTELSSDDTVRDKLAARRFLLKAIDNNGAPEKIPIDVCVGNK